jgi:SNF2 family DNA or RNA helicase
MLPKQQISYNNVLYSKSDEVHYGMNSISLFSIINELKQICNYDEDSKESVKLDTIGVILNDAIESNKKAIIFSQYVATLERIKERLQYNSVIYSGKLSEKKKDIVLNDFKNNSETNILLMSLKAGAVGLNIQEADLVIMFDRWWNPQVENQAVNRAHRFGRNTNLHVIYFTVTNSIEERISRILSEKREIFNEYIEQAESFKDIHFKEEIIEYLLKFKD